jgi:hypothetical protein
MTSPLIIEPKDDSDIVRRNPRLNQEFAQFLKSDLEFGGYSIEAIYRPLGDPSFAISVSHQFIERMVAVAVTIAIPMLADGCHFL